MSKRIPRGGGGRPTTTGLLLTACLGLAAVIYFELEGQTTLSGVAQSMPAGRGTGAAAEAVAAAQPVETRFEMPPLAVFSEIPARPLFSPTRRPPPPPEEAPPPEEPPPERGQFMLRGVAIAGDQRVALLERRATGELVRALEGQSVDGWRVTGIAAGQAVLEAAGDSYVIEVEKDVGGPAPMPAPERPERARRRAAAAGLQLGPNADDPEALSEEPLDPDAEEFFEEEEQQQELEEPDAGAAAGRRRLGG